MGDADPSGSPPDPVAFARDAHDHDMTLIQDGDLFHSVVVGYGSMGMVYAYTLECRDPFWLRESNDFRPWNDVDPVAEARANRHYKVNIDLVSWETNPACWVRSWNVTSSNGRTPTERKETEENVDDFFSSLVDEIFKSAVQGKPYPSGPPWKVRGDFAPFGKDRKETASYIALRRRRAR